MKLVILTTPKGQIPAIKIDLEEGRTTNIHITLNLYPFTLTQTADGKLTAFAGYEHKNAIAMLLLDTDTKQPIITAAIDIESIVTGLPAPSEETEFDYSTDPDEMTPSEIASRTIR